MLEQLLIGGISGGALMLFVLAWGILGKIHTEKKVQNISYWQAYKLQKLNWWQNIFFFVCNLLTLLFGLTILITLFLG